MKTTLTLMQDMDEPIADSACLPLQYLSARAKAEGIKVALVGEGADELFCGYRDVVVHSFTSSSLWRAVASMRRIGAGGHARALRALAREHCRGIDLGLIGAFDVAASIAMGQGRFRSGAEVDAATADRACFETANGSRAEPARDPAQTGSDEVCTSGFVVRVDSPSKPAAIPMPWGPPSRSSETCDGAIWRSDFRNCC